MTRNIPDNIITRAVDIWCRKIFDPVFDNGDTSDGAFLGHAIATTNIQNDKNKTQDMPERVETFRITLTLELSRLRDNPDKGEYFDIWLDVDYGPCKLLADAADTAGIPHSQFSCKSSVSMRENCVCTSFGYGAATMNHYPMADGKWLVTSLQGDYTEMTKVIDSVANGNPLELTVE